MKNQQKGFIIPLLLIIIAILLAGGGAYVYMQQKTTEQSGGEKIDCAAMNLPPDCNAGVKEVPPGTQNSVTGTNQTQQATQTSDSKTYTNAKYGFSFSLPTSWEGYSIIPNTWSGDTNGPNGDMVVATGPMVSIRHPLWTSQNPRQDIPIMIFTIQQWNDLQQGNFHIGAAPVGPSELGRNANYVFVLPARYNYASPIGWEEVGQILNSSPLHAF